MKTTHHPYRILIVDNDPNILDMCSGFLIGVGYDVSTADTAKEALRIAQDRPVDLVLTDLKMPEMDGIELMHALTEMDPSLGVVVITGYGNMDTAISALQAGALDFLVKPLDLERVQISVSQALDRVMLRDENARLRSLVHLIDVNEAIALSLDPSDLFRKVLDAASQETRSTRGSIMLEDPESGELYIAESVGWDREKAKQVRIRPGEGIAGKVFAEDESVVVRDIAKDDRFNRPSHRQYKTGSFLCVLMRTQKKKVGVLNLNDKEGDLPFTEADEEVASILATQSAIVHDNACLLEQERERSSELQEALQKVEVTYEATLDALVSALDLRDTNTYGHSQRVAQYTVEIARRLGMGGEELVIVERGALLHDIGKIGVPDEILSKPGRLTGEDWSVMKRHPSLGYSMLDGVGFLRGAAPIVLHHQEKYNGDGYPDGVSHKEIEIGARIFAIADTLDAITSDRPYRRALSYEAARQEILRYSGMQFDPTAVKVFLEISPRRWNEIKTDVEQKVREKHRKAMQHA